MLSSVYYYFSSMYTYELSCRSINLLIFFCLNWLRKHSVLHEIGSVHTIMSGSLHVYVVSYLVYVYKSCTYL